MRSEARIDLGAVRDNVAALASRTADDAQVMAVVKADGYGHGMVQCAHAAVQGGASWLGVAFLEEALALRAAGLGVPILAWLTTPGEDLAAAVTAGVDLGAYDPAQLAAAVLAGRATGSSGSCSRYGSKPASRSPSCMRPGWRQRGVRCRTDCWCRLPSTTVGPS